MYNDELSTKQIQIIEFIKKELQKKGYPPSVREICDAVNLKSTSTVHGHLERLEKKGFIRRDPTKPRAIEILYDEMNIYKKEVIEIPILGRVTAGLPILAQQNIEDTFAIPVEFIGRETSFMLVVKGDSMINAGILDGDYVIVRQQSTAQSGDIVVALLDEEEATVKTFYRESNGYYRLQPQNANYTPIITQDLKILGIVTGVFRKF